jgi:hypothetical protein
MNRNQKTEERRNLYRPFRADDKTPELVYTETLFAAKTVII